MVRMFRAGYVRHFLSGFAMGAVALIGFHAAQPDQQPMFPTAETASTVS